MKVPSATAAKYAITIFIYFVSIWLFYVKNDYLEYISMTIF